MKSFYRILAAVAIVWGLSCVPSGGKGWIRINQLGYLPSSTKVAVLMSDTSMEVTSFRVIDAYTDSVVAMLGVRPTGPLGGMAATFRLDFSSVRTPGVYFLEAGGVRSSIFPVDGGVYDGTADFVLNYMRQQRCGWNPVLRDSCHVKDGYITYHPEKEGQRIDVTGGWHDASDCLQYTTTSANAIYQMLFAYQRHPEAFGDTHKADGTPGSDGIPDIVNEIYWGLDWLDRMNPEPGEFYNQIADDRDHVGMRLPADDPADYGWGANNGRPVYYCSGEPQVRHRRRGGVNATTGVASTTGKFASAFALGAEILAPYYPEFAAKIRTKADDAFRAGLEKPGVCQTASVVSPYIYEEGNWEDDMELAAAELYRSTGDGKYLDMAVQYGRSEPVTPWMGADTARHYQWYPFMNMGHVRLAETGNEEFVENLRSGIEKVYARATESPFLYGIPPVWCSNNLTVAMLTQCILYRSMTGDRRFEEMEGALRDWLFGCNPWGVSMVVELPRGGVYPTQPHSFMIVQGVGTTTGGLVDGPVYSSIFNSLSGVNMEGGVNYMEFQPGFMVYHDSVHDYSTNEPTMDGTASLTFPLSFYQMEGHGGADRNVYVDGGIVRTDPSRKEISLVFTADTYADGAGTVIRTLRKRGIKASFFFTGRFYDMYPELIDALVAEGHYVGTHSDGHLLYMPWENRDSLLVSREEFTEDMLRAYRKMASHGIVRTAAPYFIPPYEYYNAEVASWARSMGLQVVNFTSGTGTNADYTTPDMASYRSSREILDRLFEYESRSSLNGHILLVHFGTDPARTDKFYDRLDYVIRRLEKLGYRFRRIDEAVSEKSIIFEPITL